MTSPSEDSPEQRLQAWQRTRLEQARRETFEASRFPAVTALAYHFWDGQRFDLQFERLEGALYETWRQCGTLRTVLVVNMLTPVLERFVSDHAPYVSALVNSALEPGNLASMSVDCNANLATYFETDFVLVVQNDGFPLRQGLEEFLGLYDFIGAPFVRNTARNRLLRIWPRFAVGNGGFSLRSRRICELASDFWNKRYHRLLPHSGRYAREDAYCCFVLPLLEPSFRKAVKIAPWEEARRFAYDGLCDDHVEALPFGFHGARAFDRIARLGLLQAGRHESAQDDTRRSPP